MTETGEGIPRLLAQERDAVKSFANRLVESWTAENKPFTVLLGTVTGLADYEVRVLVDPEG